jgi:hypothetical protein
VHLGDLIVGIDISDLRKNWSCLRFADEDSDCCGVWGESLSPQAELDRISGLL